MKRKTVNYRTEKPQHLDGIVGPVTVLYSGRCINCNRTVYRTDENECPDPRGFIRPDHCASILEAEEYGMVGPKVLACWDCAQEDAKRYERTLSKAKKQWKPKPCCKYEHLGYHDPGLCSECTTEEHCVKHERV